MFSEDRQTLTILRYFYGQFFSYTVYQKLDNYALRLKRTLTMHVGDENFILFFFMMTIYYG